MYLRDEGKQKNQISETTNKFHRKKEVLQMAEKKITIVEQFEMVKAELEKVGRDDLVEFINGRIAVQNKKAENRKPTKTQEANEVFKGKIVEILKGADAPMTATEILNKNAEDFGTVQKVTALLTALVNEKVVEKDKDKKRTVFFIK